MAENERQERAGEEESRGGELIDLVAVDAWAHQRKSIWEAQGCTVEICPITQASPTNSIRIEIDSPTFVSTTIVWESGDWEVTAGHVEADHAEGSDYQPAQSTEDVISKVETELRRMGIVQ